MGEYINDIKIIMSHYIKTKYKQFLSDNKILCIKKTEINNIAYSFYTDNIKEIKNEIRTKMKSKYLENYPTGTVENIILDICQDSVENIKVVIAEINFIQDKNFLIIDLPITNNSLNLNISNTDGFIIINRVKDTFDKNLKHIYDEIIKYKFIYSINEKILDDFSEKEKIDIIKQEITNNTIVKLGVYYLLENGEKT
tara:strand:+ start:2008 stop:2598 length:591 start_codon:yes stop_codon:yes gene_type:complete